MRNSRDWTVVYKNSVVQLLIVGLTGCFLLIFVLCLTMKVISENMLLGPPFGIAGVAGMLLS